MIDLEAFAWELRPRLAILMTCFNRRVLTLSALGALDGAVAKRFDYRVFLVDDGSTDGTSQEVAERFPDVVIVMGTGTLFWNGGMRLAWQSALGSKPDFFLWLNDDTALRAHAIADLLSLYQKINQPRTIITGCTADPRTGEITYGGYRRGSGLSRLRFRHLRPEETECDTMNGNCVLIPAIAAREIGINSDAYRHAYGDNDYGLRAGRAGYRIVELKTPVALQKRNERYAAALDRLDLRNWRFILFHPKGVALAEWFAFCRAHGGPLWLLNFLWRYVKMTKKGLLGEA